MIEYECRDSGMEKTKSFTTNKVSELEMEDACRSFASFRPHLLSRSRSLSLFFSLLMTLFAEYVWICVCVCAVCTLCCPSFHYICIALKREWKSSLT